MEPYDLLDQQYLGCFAPVYAGTDRAGGDRPIRILNLKEYSGGLDLAASWNAAIRPLHLNHRHVVSTYPPYQPQGWIVTERVAGQLGGEAGKRLKPDQARTLLRQMLDALEQYHTAGLIHGGVCPTAFLIDDKRFAKLDYSPSLLFNGEVLQRMAHHEFTPPETINPALGPIAPQADLYSLGMSVAALLLGPDFLKHFPIDDQTPETAKTSWQSWHARPGESLESVGVLAEIPAPLRSILAAMTAKQVSARPASAAEIAKQLEKVPDVAIDLPEAPAAVDSQMAISPRLDRVDNSLFKERKPAEAAKAGSSPSSNKKLLLPGAILAGLVLLLAVLGIARYQRSLAKKNPEPKVSPSTETAPKDKPPEIEPPKKVAPLEEQSDQTLKNATDDSGRSGLKKEEDNSKKTDEIEPEVKAPPPPPPPPKFFARILPTLRTQIQLQRDGQTLTPDAAGLVEVKPGETLTISGPGYESHDVKVPEVLGPSESWAISPEPKLPSGYRAVPGTASNPETGYPEEIFYENPDLEQHSPLRLRLVGADVDESYGFQTGVEKPDGAAAELPLTRHQLPRPFYVSTREITNFQVKLLQFLKEQVTDKPEPNDFNLSPARNTVFAAAQSRCSELFGGRLPTETEWELAARGAKNRAYPYPWGDSEKRVNLQATSREDAEQLSRELRDQGALSEDVSPYGLHNLLDNLAEWCVTEQDSPIIRGCSIKDDLPRSAKLGSNPTLRITRREPPEGVSSGEWLGYRLLVDTDLEFRPLPDIKEGNALDK